MGNDRDIILLFIDFDKSIGFGRKKIFKILRNMNFLEFKIRVESQNLKLWCDVSASYYLYVAVSLSLRQKQGSN